MTGPAVRVDVDSPDLRRLLAQSEAVVDAVADTYFAKASVLLRDGMVTQARDRFGRERSESRMQSFDPGRPKGLWSGSVQADQKRRELDVGPTVIYAWWIERGSLAPKGVPASHRYSDFVGHKPVQRAAESFQPRAEPLLGEALKEVLDRET